MNVITAMENPEDDRRVDIHLLFPINPIAKARIRERFREDFPNQLCEVRFRSDRDLVVIVKPNGRGVPRFEIVNYATSGFA